MIKNALLCLLCFSCIQAKQATTPWHSPQGMHYFKQAAIPKTFRLINHLDSQKTKSFCGVASIVAVLNTLLDMGKLHSASITSCCTDPLMAPWHYLSQQSLFYHKDIKHLSSKILFNGAELNQIQQVLQAYPVKVLVRTKNTPHTVFRNDLKRFLKDPDFFIIVNYARTILEQEGGGHFSVVAAYHEQSDQVLMLDVSKYKQPYFWVSRQKLIQAMGPLTTKPEGRGYLIVQPIGTQHLKKPNISTNKLI